MIICGLMQGFGVYHSLADAREQVRAIVFAFTTAEVWSVDTYWLEAYRDEQGNPTIPSSQEQAFRNALVGYSSSCKHWASIRRSSGSPAWRA